MHLGVIGSLLCLAALSSMLGCESDPVGGDEGQAGTTSAAGSAGTGGTGATPMCSAALRQSLGLVDEVATGAVERLLVPSGSDADLLLRVDASAGGDADPWVYVSLSSAAAVAVTDLEALSSTAWDLAFKRYVIRTNGGDSGAGQGGALRVSLPWDSVDASTQGDRVLPSESLLNDDCELVTGDFGDPVTTFSSWYEYDLATHTLSPVDATYLVSAADGTPYKLQLLEYVGGRYELQASALE